MRNKKCYFRGLFLLGLALLLNACSNSKHADIIVNPLHNSPIGVTGATFSLTTLPPGFRTVQALPAPPATPMIYTVILSGDTDNTCSINVVDNHDVIHEDQGLSDIAFTVEENYVFMHVSDCTEGTEVTVNIMYQIGTEKYEGSASFTA